MNGGPARVHYFDGQYLHAEDFIDEQDYHVAMQRRHAARPHSWGIVAGLQPKPLGDRLGVTPGYAIDGYGRELILTQPQSLDIDIGSLSRIDGVLEFWLQYRRRPVGTEEAARWDETPEIRTLRPGIDAPLPGAPAVPDAREATAWLGPPPDDAEAPWPVYLGSVKHNPVAPAQPIFDFGRRIYAGLVGCELRAPEGDVRLRLGGAGKQDPSCFVVEIERAAQAAEPGAAPTLWPALTLDRDGSCRIGGPVTIESDLRLEGGAVAFGATASAAPAEPGWRIVRVAQPAGGGELRIEMPGVDAPEEGEEQPGNEVVIGAWSSAGDDFRPCLTVAANGTVTVHGDLVVEGRINPGPGEDGHLTPAAREALASAQLAATSAALARQQIGAVEHHGPLISMLRDIRELLADLRKGVSKLLGLSGMRGRGKRDDGEK